MAMSKVITRFPPSPTGFFHIGSARTALFNYLYAKKNGGEMILRFEDTDKERSDQKYEKDILEGLAWLGIGYDNKKIERQSERVEIYKKHLKNLVDSGKAYLSKEEVGERDEVIRFNNPNTQIKFNDLIRGDVVFDTTELNDFVIAKSMDEPLYHLAVVVDDFEMAISHVIRGEDHISNTARQILILEALGFERPNYAHIPLILAPDRSKMSKRKGTVSIIEYKEMGYLPEALLNYLALLGWNPGDEREIFSLSELEKKFDLSRVQKGGAIFNTIKLDWLNKKYIEKLSHEEFKEIAKSYLPQELNDFKNLDLLLNLIRERIHKFGDVKDLSEQGEFDLYIRDIKCDAGKLLWKDDSKENTKEYLKEILSLLESIDNFNFEKIKEKIQPFADLKGRGSVMHPMRFALSGRDKSPDPFTIASILGKEESLGRIKKAIELL